MQHTILTSNGTRQQRQHVRFCPLSHLDRLKIRTASSTLERGTPLYVNANTSQCLARIPLQLG
jgi:hypothetical protein